MDWLVYFQRRWDDRPDIPWRLGVCEEPHLREPLIRSLQRFRLGDAAAGHNVKALAAATGDERYAEAIGYCLAEDHQHAQWMGYILERMGAEVLHSHWSDRAFTRVRRLGGLTTELMVFLVAEIIGKRFMRMLYEGTRDPVVQAVFAQISCDEIGHIAFHAETLRGRLKAMSPARRAVARAAWWGLFNAALWAVVIDHRAMLRATGLGAAEFRQSTRLLFEILLQHIFEPLDAPAPPRPVRRFSGQPSVNLG